MSLQSVKKYLETFNLHNNVLEFEESSATVELAAKAVNTQPKKIAKSLTFLVNKNVVMIVCSGDMKIDNSKFKAQFQKKAIMLSFNEVEDKVGHSVGGVCPFAIKENVKVYLDNSLKRFNDCYPACGSSNSVIKLTILQLEQCAQNFCGYVDVCKSIQSEF